MTAAETPYREVLRSLARAGLGEAEVYAKKGRSRRLERSVQGEVASYHQEQGWAVRAGAEQASLFVAGTGEPSATEPWPEPDGHPLRLPDPLPVPAWKEPSDFEAPLVGEREGFRLLEGIARELGGELPGARLLTAVLEDGSSESELSSSRGVRRSWRHRAAALRLEAATAGRRGPARTSLYLSAREARRFHPGTLARRLADSLAVHRDGEPVERDRGEMLLAPAVGQALLAGLLPLLVGRDAAERIAAFRDRRGRVADERLTLVDDGRYPGGTFEAPVDGEGTPTREVLLVSEGLFRQPLVDWREARASEHAPSGCCRRASWRDLPVPGPTHLFVRPDAGVPVGSLLSQVARGYYLLEALGAGIFALDDDRFSLPVVGFAVQSGRARRAVAEVELRGSVSGLLRGIQGVARDLAFSPMNGALGSPTLLVTGLELAARPQALGDQLGDSPLR